MKVFILLLFYFSCMSYLLGQDRFYFSKLNVKEGLSSSNVTSIFQDKKGYLWVGTNNGLNKFNGYEFIIYNKNNTLKNSLSANEIRDIVQDYEDNIWVLTPRGIDRIDHETDEITSYSFADKNFRYLLYKEKNLLAFSDLFIYKFDVDSNVFQQIDLSFKFLSIISAVTQDSLGNLYIGTYNHGVYICDSLYNLVLHLTPDNSGKGISKDIVRELLVDKKQNLWMVLDKKGIECFHLPTKTLSKLEHTTYEIIGNHIRTLIDWDANYFLLGTFNGLALLNKNDLTVTPIESNLGKEGGLSHHSVYQLFKDRQQTLWIGTYSGGLNYYNRYNNRFELIIPKIYSGIIRRGEEDRNGTLWFATEGGGIFSYNPVNGEQKNFLLESEGNIYYNNLVKTLLVKDDSIICTTFKGKVYSFVPRTGHFRLLYDFGYNDIYSLYLDSKGKLWIPTNTLEGLVIADGKNLNTKSLLNKELKTIQTLTVIQELPGYRFLIGTYDQGFYLYFPEEKKQFHFSNQELNVPDKEKIHITAFYLDSNQDIWVSSNKHGVWRFDNELKMKKHYTPADGIDSQIFYITEDKEGFFWIMGARDLYRFHKENGVVNQFNAKNGIELDEFSMFSGTITRNGKLYLSGLNGIQYIDPENLRYNNEAPPVLLTNLFINNKEVTPQTKNSPLHKKLQETQHLILKHNQTNLSIGYTALNYIYPEENQYAYKLEGIDQDWNYVNNRREAFYSNLKPGTYRFHVIASNNDKIWNNEGASLLITVLPPYWLRWWAYLIYTSIILFLAWRFLAWRYKKKALQKTIMLKQIEQEKQEELNKERNRFFTYATHEFRTPLTLIINPVQDLMNDNSLKQETKTSLQFIHKNARRLESLVNSIMDIQKNNVREEKLNISSFDFRQFLQEIYYNFQATAPGRKLTFTLDLPFKTLWVTYSPEELEKVFLNLISNAFKFTPEGGTIQLQGSFITAKNYIEILPDKIIPDFSESPTWLYIAVKDTGIGIKDLDSEKLFEPFYSSANDLHGNTVGSGIGLTLAKTIVEQHGGKIVVRSLQPGTEMGVLLPFYYDPSAPLAKEESLYNEESSTIITSDKTKILLVEDNPEILSYTYHKLKENYKVLTAVNGADAWEIIEKQFPDLVVSDVMMPVMDGIELCHKIKNTMEYSHISVILLTAKSMPVHIEEGFTAGADDYIVKPFNLGLLKIRIQNLLEGRRRIKEIYYKRFSLENVGVKIESLDDIFIDKYMQIVREHISDPEFGIDDICKEMGFSRANFYRKIKSVTNLTPVEMIKNIRLEKAVILLRESNLSVSEIAFKVGFNNHSYFTSCFKNLYGISPTEFQEKEKDSKAD